jgi:hypothetical protein
MKIRIIFLFVISSTFLFGQNQSKIESEFDTISGLGVVKLKKLIIDRVDYHRKKLESNDSNDRSHFDKISIDKRNVNIDYLDITSINAFEKELTNLTIRKLTWTKKYINDKIGWKNRIEILTDKSNKLKTTGYKIEIPSKRNKIEKRSQNGKLIFEYPRTMNYLDVHQTNFVINDNVLRPDEMIVWIIYDELEVEFNMYVK